MNAIIERKRAELLDYIQREVVPEQAVQAIVVIGSVAKGNAREDSDIDAFVFLDPLDLYAVPAEAKWRVEDGSFHGIFSDIKNPIQLDFKRVDLRIWSDPTFQWPETICAELSEGWMAFDRFGRITPLIKERTQFTDPIRQNQLDAAINKLNWLLSDAKTGRPWETLNPTAAHYRLHSACDYLVQALFAYNRRWRTLRSRELADLLTLAWLPTRFEEQLFLAMNAVSAEKDGYQQRVSILSHFFDEIVTKCVQDGLYTDNALDEAFIRQHDEPGRGWNMAAWVQEHTSRKSKPSS